jgi:hypothetical protein
LQKLPAGFPYHLKDAPGHATKERTEAKLTADFMSFVKILVGRGPLTAH